MSAKLLADTGGDVLTLKRHSSWKSGSVAESYVADRLTNKIKVARMIQSQESSAGARIIVFRVILLFLPGQVFIIHADSKCVINVHTYKST